MAATLAVLDEYAQALRRRAAQTADHRIWRTCRDLADCLDALVRAVGGDASSDLDRLPRSLRASLLDLLQRAEHEFDLRPAA